MKIGDIAVIDGFEYPIREITNDGIYIRNDDDTLALLIYRGNQWAVQNSNESHEISFIKGEDNPLLKLNDEQLFRLCHTNPLCDEHFWRFKIIQEFGPATAKYKFTEETYKEQYLSILKSIDWITSKYLDPPVIDLFLIDPRLHREEWEIYREAYDNYHRHIDWILAFLYKGRIHKQYASLIIQLMTIDDVDIWNSIKRLIMALLKTNALWSLNNPNVLYWVLEQENLDDRVLSNVASYAILIENLDIVEKLSNQGIYPREAAIKIVVTRANIDMFKWLIEKGLINNAVIREIIRDSDQLMEKLMIYQLLYKHGLLTDKAFNSIRQLLKNDYRTTYMHMPTLLWLKDIGELNQEELVEMRNIAMENDHADLLSDMFNAGLLNEDDLEYIVSITPLNRRKILLWLADLP